MEGAGGAQRRDSAASNDRGRQENRDGEYQIGLREHRAGGYPAQVEFYRDATFELSFGRAFDVYGRLRRRQDRVGLPAGSGSVFGSTAPSFFDHDLGYNLNTPLPVLWMYETSTPGGYQDSLFTVNAEFDATNADGLFGALGGTHETYTRDAAGRVTGISTSFSVYGVGYYTLPSLALTYNPANQRQVQTLTSGSGTQAFTYDTRGLVATRAVTFERVAGVTTLGTFSYQHDALGRNTLLTYPDGHTRTQVWDELGRLRSRCYGAYPGGGATRCYTADYDEVGNPTLLGDPERSCTIGYDSLDRVSSVTCNDGNTETYAYNALGALSVHAGVAVDHQRPRLAGGGSASAGLPATHGGQPVTVDAVGKVTALGSATLEWNRLGRLTKTTQGAITTEYGHDAHFRRVVQKRTGSPLELYLYEGANIAAVASGDGVAGVQRRYLFDGVDHPVWMFDKAADAGVYFELDCIGNVRRLRGGARYGAGAPLPSDLGGYKYTAFGRTLAADAGTPAPVVDGGGFEQALRWQGRPWDSVTGSYDFRNRVWSPDLAAFLSPDEFIYHRGTGTLWSWPGQNPIRWRDPSGRDQGSGDAIGESMMLQREDLSSDQMQSISVYRGAGVFAEFAALFAALGGVAAAEAGAAATLQRGLISNQGSLRMLAKLAASAISGARACGDPGYSGGSSGGSGRTASTPLGKSIESLKQTLGGGGGPWKLLTAHAESATSPAKRLQGATSMEEIFVNQDTGERLVRHTIFKDGEILHETFRPFAKFGSE